MKIKALNEPTEGDSNSLLCAKMESLRSNGKHMQRSPGSALHLLEHSNLLFDVTKVKWERASEGYPNT